MLAWGTRAMGLFSISRSSSSSRIVTIPTNGVMMSQMIAIMKTLGAAV